MILIIGAGGATGVPALRHLAKRGAAVRAMTSNEGSADRLDSLGAAETVIGDMRSDADVRRAMDGVRTVYHIGPRFIEDEFEIGQRVIAAAKGAGVGHFVFHSAFHSQMRAMDHHWRKLLVEEALIESGLPYTILQPCMYMQNIRVEWASIVTDGVYPRPYSPHRKMAIIDSDDMGEAAAIVLTEPGYAGATFELCGPEPLTHAEMAEILADALGRPVRAEARGLEDWTAWAREQGHSDYYIGAYLKMCRHYDAHGFPGGNALVLRTILGREPNDFRTFARKFVAEQGAG